MSLLKWAKAGKPLVTQDGQRAKFIAHVPRAKREHRLIVLVNGEIWRRQSDGRHCATCTGSVYPAILKGSK